MDNNSFNGGMGNPSNMQQNMSPNMQPGMQGTWHARDAK